MEEKRRELQSALDRLTAEAESLAQGGRRSGAAARGDP